MKSSTSQELGLRPFDITEFLDNDVAITEYLTQVLADGDHEELLAAIGHVARARGMTDLARQTGLGRESLYKALRPGADPRFSTCRPCPTKLPDLRSLGCTCATRNLCCQTRKIAIFRFVTRFSCLFARFCHLIAPS